LFPGTNAIKFEMAHDGALMTHLNNRNVSVVKYYLEPVSLARELLSLLPIYAP